MNKIQERNITVYTLNGVDYPTLEDAIKASDQKVLSALLNHCYEDSSSNITEEESLVDILDILIIEGLTSKAKLQKLKKRVLGEME